MGKSNQLIASLGEEDDLSHENHDKYFPSSYFYLVITNLTHLLISSIKPLRNIH